MSLRTCIVTFYCHHHLAHKSMKPNVQRKTLGGRWGEGGGVHSFQPTIILQQSSCTPPLSPTPHHYHLETTHTHRPHTITQPPHPPTRRVVNFASPLQQGKAEASHRPGPSKPPPLPPSPQRTRVVDPPPPPPSLPSRTRIVDPHLWFCR